VSRRHAEECYGVVFRDDYSIDEDATAKQRGRQQAGKISLAVIATEKDDFLDGRRMCSVAASTLERLGVREGAAIEFVSLAGAAARLDQGIRWHFRWMCTDRSKGCAILGWPPGIRLRCGCCMAAARREIIRPGGLIVSAVDAEPHAESVKPWIPSSGIARPTWWWWVRRRRCLCGRCGPRRRGAGNHS